MKLALWLYHKGDDKARWWVDIAFADIDTISIYLTQNIGNIESVSIIHILYCSTVWLLTHFVIARKVINDVNVAF